MWKFILKYHIKISTRVFFLNKIIEGQLLRPFKQPTMLMFLTINSHQTPPQPTGHQAWSKVQYAGTWLFDSLTFIGNHHNSNSINATICILSKFKFIAYTYVLLKMGRYPVFMYVLLVTWRFLVTWSHEYQTLRGRLTRRWNWNLGCPPILSWA